MKKVKMIKLANSIRTPDGEELSLSPLKYNVWFNGDLVIVESKTGKHKGQRVYTSIFNTIWFSLEEDKASEEFVALEESQVVKKAKKKAS